MRRRDQGASLRDRATRASTEPQERLGHTASVPCAFTPWALECVFAGGELKGVDAEIAALDECEPYGLAQYAVVSTTEMTGMKRRNPATKAFDIPVPRTVTEVVFDPRREDADKRIAEARLIAAAPELYEALDAMVCYLLAGDFENAVSIAEHDGLARLAKARGDQ